MPCFRMALMHKNCSSIQPRIEDLYEWAIPRYPVPLLGRSKTEQLQERLSNAL